MSAEPLNSLQYAIARYLVSMALRKQRTTYQQVGEAIGWKHPTGRGLGNHLEALLRYLHKQGLPPLTTILVKKGERYPAEDAMAYIRDVLGDFDIEVAQRSVFSFDWRKAEELMSASSDPSVVSDNRSKSKPSGTDRGAPTNVFLLKFNGSLHGPDGISRPQRTDDWNMKFLRMPWEGPRPSSQSDRSPGPEVSPGDLLYLWAHEDEAYGSGLGLTGTATADEVVAGEETLNIRLSNVALLPRPLGFRALGNVARNSVILDRIHNDRSPRAWVMTTDEQSEINRLIANYGHLEAASKSAAETTYLSELDRALVAERDEVNAAEFARKTAIVKARPGQQQFRADAMLRHGGRCVVTGTGVPYVLEAAHVIPHTGSVAFEVPENSLILRRDVHALFDAGLIGIHDISSKLVVADCLASTSYGKLAGRVINHRLAQASLRYQFARFRKAEV